MEIEKKACPSSVADLQSQYDEVIDFIEREEAYTVDPKSQARIRAKLVSLGVWKPL
jgi:hypothetical protein